jgi:hypothetical protein
VWIDALTAQTKVAASQGGDRCPLKARGRRLRRHGRRTQAFYEQIATEESGRYWWWLHQVYIDPKVVIAEDDSGEYWMVPYPYDAARPVTFGDPVQVFIQWVNKEDGKVAASVSIPEQFGQLRPCMLLRVSRVQQQ